MLFISLLYMDFKVQHPKITYNEKSKIVNENHQKTVMRQNGNRNLHQTRKSQLEFSYQNKTH